MISIQYFAMIYLAFANSPLVLIASSATANIVEKKFLVLLIYILGKPLDEMAFSDQSHTEHLGHSHLWIFQHGEPTLDIDTVQCQ